MTVPTATSAPPPATEPKARADSPPDAPRDTTREVFETVVFVVVLVLLLKLFVAEAFVIPTGSMAPTLWGDQVRCTCRECGHKFPINASDGGRRVDVNAYICENCGFFYSGRDIRDKDVSTVSSGDRVLVSKYEYHLHEPHRFDVPVFKYPVEPYSPAEMQGMNYIKRLVGLGGETIAVFMGDLYTTRDLTYDHILPEERPQNELDAWQFRYMYTKDQKAKDYFKEGKFQIVRKDPDQILAVKRIVFNLDRQPKSREGVRKTRWHPDPSDGTGWQMEEAGFKHTGDTPGWVLYQHIDPWDDSTLKPYYIVDSIGYNTRDNNRPFVDNPGDHWVSDLLVECTAEIGSPDAEVTLELAKGRDRFQAVFTKGECKLFRVTAAEDGSEERREMGSHATKMTKGGKYALRLADVDCRLTVWVDNKVVPFGRDQTDYTPPDPSRKFEPYEPNDLQRPARVGARGDVKVAKVSLWRDLLYTCAWDRVGEKRKPLEPDPTDYPRSCDIVQTYYVQPGHYLMFGDNSNSSADSRSWGLVPKRLMLGKAVMVYWPFGRMGVIE
jgi:signal peptidase I